MKSFHDYQSGSLDISGLQQNIAAFMGAIEGDVPRELREHVIQAENQNDSIRFTVLPFEQKAAVAGVLRHLETTIARGSSQADS